jgi:uncharacterized protein YyaL (SSP411 family)
VSSATTTDPKKKKGHAYGLLITAVILVGSSAAALFVYLSPGGPDLPGWLYGLHRTQAAPERPRRPMIVKWEGWTKKAFDRARREDKLLLVQLPAEWDHASRLMDETTFADPAVSQWLDENVVAVRVDADERPDAALPYLGGYPTSALILPSGEALSVASFAYPDRFLGWARQVNDSYRRDPARVRDLAKSARDKAEKLRASRAARPAPSDAQLDRLREGAASKVLAAFDPAEGGFGPAPKFPRSEPVRLLLASGDPEALAAVSRTLDAELRLQDLSDGGFFRYASRADWSEPHREKTLETQARLIVDYALAAGRLSRSDYRETAKHALDYARTHLLASDGSYFSAQSADDGTTDRRRWSAANAKMVEALLELGKKPDAIQLGKLWLKRGIGRDGAVRHELGSPSTAGLLADQAAWVRAFRALSEITSEPAFRRARADVSGYALRKLKGQGGLVAGPVRPGLPEPPLDPEDTLALVEEDGGLRDWCAANPDLFEPAAFALRILPK